jgi:hypothetical protein
MIDILSTMQAVLQEAGFTTHLIALDRSPVVLFEDDTLLGFGCVFDEPGATLAQWRSAELSLLRRYAGPLRDAGDKAWNVYFVLLCRHSGTPAENRQIRWIEEDLDHTRKITGCGVATREELVRTLLPLLPFQYQPVLKPEDATQRFERRIRAIAPRAAAVVLDETVSTDEIVRLLGEPL